MRRGTWRSGKVGAEEFFIVSDIDVFVSKGGMRPGDTAALVELSLGRTDEFRTADLVETLG